MTATPLLAHEIGAEAKVKGNEVVVEVFYDDGTVGRDVIVTATDSAAKEIAKGKTDAKGLWKFPLPAPGKYTLLIDGGPGHKTKISVTVPTK